MAFVNRNLLSLVCALVCVSGNDISVFGLGAPLDERTKTTDEYRQFAMIHEGDASRGKSVFQDEQRIGCSRCHSIDGHGSKAGPDLFAVGDQFARRDLIDAVLMPSATIAVGYNTTAVETKIGEEFQGVLKQAADSFIELMGADGQRVRIAKGDIQVQRGSSVSFMPEGLQASLSLQEFTDLIEYLVTLKQPEHALTSYRGMPGTIPHLARLIILRPFLDEELRSRPC